MAETKNPPVITVKQPYYTSDGTKLFLGTSTEVQRDANGKYIPGSAVTSLRLYDTTFSPLGTDYKTVAIREAGKSWTLTKDGNGNTVAGKNLQQTLANPNSLMNVNLNNHISNSMGAPLQGVPAGQRNPNTKQDVQQAVGINTNTSTTPPNAGAGTSIARQSQSELQSGIESRDVRTKYAVLSYPLNRNQKQDYIKFEMLEYSPKKINTDVLNTASNEGLDKALDVFGERNEGKDRTVLGVVSLPISSPISDTNTVNWADKDYDSLKAAAAAAALGLIDQGQSNTSPQTQPGQDAQSGSQQTISGAKKLVGSALADAAAGNAGGGFFTRATGAILNPNVELLFNGPSLRTFSFTFPLVARSQKESEQILQIIRFFKQGMSVKRSKSVLFLKSPHTFRIKYVYAKSGKDHPWINKIKECALTNCSVNYTPAGNYATYANGAMTMYEMTLNFSELEPIFDDDYGNTAGSPAIDINQDGQPGSGIGY